MFAVCSCVQCYMALGGYLCNSLHLQTQRLRQLEDKYSTVEATSDFFFHLVKSLHGILCGAGSEMFSNRTITIGVSISGNPALLSKSKSTSTLSWIITLEI